MNSSVALLITRSLIGILSPNWWGGLNSWLFHFYDSVGLHGVLYLFSWPLWTVYMIQSALPYMVLVLIMRLVLFKNTRRCFDRSRITISILKWCVVVFLPAPVILVIMRVFIPTSSSVSGSGSGYGLEGEVLYWVAYTMFLILLGFPYAVLSLALHYFLFRKSQRVT